MTEQLGRYVLERQITPAEYQAALMFFADHEAAREYLRFARTADRAGAERYRRACHALGDLRHVTVAVVVKNHGCSTWAFQNGLRRAEGMARLRDALGVLADVYRDREAA